jgi:diguanylate cyclase (GGDEF)-like protein
MSGRSAGYVRFQRQLALGYLTLFALLTGLFAWKVTAGYSFDRDSAAAATSITAKAMASHVEEMVDAIDQPLRAAERTIGAMDRRAMTPEAVERALSASASNARFWMLFTDASGDAVAASNGLAVGGVSFANQSCFAEAAASRSTSPRVGGPVQDRISNQKVFFVCRRVESRDGKFVGIVAAPVDASRVASVFERARLGPAMSITLATRGSKIIARAPLFESSFGADLSNLMVAVRPPGPLVAFEASSPLNGERRLFSYAAVGSLPLVMVVGVTRESWTARIRSEAAGGAMLLAIAVAAAALSVWLALKQYARLERVEAWQRKLIEQLAAAKADLARGERRLRFIADRVPARVAYINADERYMFHNNGRDKAPLGAIMGKTILETHGPLVYDLIKDDVHRALAGERVSVERRYALNGQDKHFKHQYDPDVDEHGRVVGFYAMVTDITEFKDIQRRLAHAAQLDPLTGLPNRAGLLNCLEAAMARSRRTGKTLACLYLDLDKFKDVNDALGHSGGDAVLIEFGRRLRQCVRESDTVARIAGDEFVIALEALDQPAEARLVAAKIIESMQAPFHIEGVRRSVTTSVGLAFADPLIDEPKSLLRAADEALYRAKREGRNRVAGESEDASS